METLQHPSETTVTVTMYHCRCGHQWIPRVDTRPRRCPQCGDANWDKPYRWRREKKTEE